MVKNYFTLTVIALMFGLDGVRAQHCPWDVHRIVLVRVIDQYGDFIPGLDLTLGNEKRKYRGDQFKFCEDLPCKTKKSFFFKSMNQFPFLKDMYFLPLYIGDLDDIQDRSFACYIGGASVTDIILPLGSGNLRNHFDVDARKWLHLLCTGNSQLWEGQIEPITIRVIR